MHFRAFIISEICSYVLSSYYNIIVTSTRLERGYMLAKNVILQQGGYPGSVGTVWAGEERFHLAEVVHVLSQATPVAVPFRALDATQLVLAAFPNVTRQSVTEESQVG